MDLKEAKGRLQHLYKENKNTLAVFSTTSKVKEDYLKENEAIETILQELDNLQKENEELKKRFKRYGDVDLVRLAQIKEIELSVPKIYIDKETLENLLKEE